MLDVEAYLVPTIKSKNARMGIPIRGPMAL